MDAIGVRNAAIAVILLVSAAAPDVLAADGPGRIRFAPALPAQASSDAVLAGKAAQWVDPARSEAAKPSQRPLSFGGLLIAYHNGEPAETCAGQFISPNLILTTASCVSDSVGEHLSGPFELYQGYSRRDYDRRYVGQCMAYYENWKGDAAGDYSYDYALIWSPKRSQTGFYRFKLPPFLRPLRLYDIQKRKPVLIDGAISNGISVVVKFKPKFPGDAPEMRGGAWIYKFSKENDPSKNIVSSITSHVDKDGVIYGPGIDRAFSELYNAVNEGCADFTKAG